MQKFDPNADREGIVRRGRHGFGKPHDHVRIALKIPGKWRVCLGLKGGAHDGTFAMNRFLSFVRFEIRRMVKGRIDVSPHDL